MNSDQYFISLSYDELLALMSALESDKRRLITEAKEAERLSVPNVQKSFEVWAEKHGETKESIKRQLARTHWQDAHRSLDKVS